MAAETKHFNTGHPKYIFFVFILLALIWGSSFILMKRGIESFSLWQVASMRLMAAMIVLLPWTIFRIQKIQKEHLKFVFFSSVFAMFLPAFLFSAGQTSLNSAVVGVLNSLTPIFTFLIGLFFFKKTFQSKLFLPILAGMAGAILLIVTNAKGEIALNLYVLFILLATLCYGLNTNIIKHYIPDMPALTLSTVSVGIAGLMSAIVFFFTDWRSIDFTKPKVVESFIAVVVLGVFGTGIAQILFNSVLRKSSAVMASTVTYLIPVIAVFWGVLDGEQFTFMHIVGMTIVFCSVLWMGRSSMSQST